MRMEECEVLHEINLRNSWSCLSMLKIKIFTQFLSWTSSGNIEEWQTLVSFFLWCFCSQTHRYIMSIRRIHSTSHHRAESFVVSFWYFYICYCLMLSQCNSFEQYVIKLNMTFVVRCAICWLMVVLKFFLLYLMKIEFDYFLEYSCPVTCCV